MPKAPDAIVLCGGAGLRLRDVTGSSPKSMGNSRGPSVFGTAAQTAAAGMYFERIILAVGYQRDAISSCFGERAHGLHLIYSAETSPLGTGGALRKAADLVQSDTVLIMNGDSYTDADLIRFVVDHAESKADGSMIVVLADGRSDCGSVVLDQIDRLVRFEEKQGPFGAQYLNAGIYLLSRALLFDIPPRLQVSLERELLPRWLKEGHYIKGFLHSGTCVDIGTPERYRNAQDILVKAEAQDSTFAKRNLFMNVMITGAGGFIGGFLLARGSSADAGCSVLGLDISEPAEVVSGERFEFCDVRDEGNLSRLLSTFRPDRIFHLAAQSFPTVSLTYPRETIEINVGGTVNLFECVRSCGITPVIVVACSSAEYGPVASGDLPTRETHPLRPLHPYGVSKVAQDLLAAQYFANYSISSVRIRIFNCTGPGKIGVMCVPI